MKRYLLWTTIKKLSYSISELLKYEGYQVVKAYDGMEALKALETNQIDLILLDVMMPKLNGLSALDEIKGKLPYSGYYSVSEDERRVTRCQVLFWEQMTTVEKPYNPSELIARCESTSQALSRVGRRSAENRQ